MAFAAAAPIGAGRAHGYRVAVHQAAHLAGGQHEVALAVGRERYGKTEAVFMCFNAAFHQREFFGSAHHAAPVDEDLPVARHRGQAAFEKGHFMLGDIEQDSQRFSFQRHAPIFQHFGNPFAAGQGVFVALCFPLQIRVLQSERGFLLHI